MHVLAAIIAEAIGNYPVTESTVGIKRVSVGDIMFTMILDRDCPSRMVYGLPRSTYFPV